MDGNSLLPQEIKIEELKKLFPEVFDEGKVDFEKLKATLGENIEFSNERYVLNWAGKSDAFKILQLPTSKTLVPFRSESVDFDNTQNIFIEGENLDVLKVLQKSYFGKVKMIYIDPPYNTGNDFVYKDDFKQSLKQYQAKVGDVDDEGNTTKSGLFKNSKDGGRYHSNWLNMMMPRLYLAKNLLRDDGVIFVSIDDNEVHNLRMLMNEVFGEENFVVELPRITKKAGKSSTDVSKNNDSILIYKKDKSKSALNRIEHTDSGFKFEDEFVETRGKYKLNQTLDYGSIQYSPSLDYEISINEGYFRPGGVTSKEMEERKFRNPKTDFCWRWSKKMFDFGYNNKFIVVKLGRLKGRIYTKTYQLATISKNQDGYFIEYRDRDRALSSLDLIENIYSNDNAKKDIVKILDKAYFDYTKPLSLIIELTKRSTNNQTEDIILDFFAGSGTTAHAVMELNKQDGGNRKYICVQMPEEVDEKSEAFKSGFKSIAEITKERIRRAVSKIGDEMEDKSKIDLGFKVLKLEESNFKEWRQIAANDTDGLKKQMEMFIDPVKDNANIENIMYELLLKSGMELNSKIEKKDGFILINNGEVVFILEKVSTEIIKEVIAQNPKKVISLDKLFEGDDKLKTNSVLQMKQARIDFKTI